MFEQKLQDFDGLALELDLHPLFAHFARAGIELENPEANGSE